jgi:hypothetical protein
MSPHYDYVRRTFHYDPETGNLFKLGKLVGAPGTRKQVWFMNTSVKATRLIWLWMTGDWPANVIDHINRDPSDDRWCNLRDVTFVENLHNSTSFGGRLVSGFYGVRRLSSGKYRMQVWHGGRNVTKNYITAELAAWMHDILQAKDKGCSYPTFNHPEWLECFGHNCYHEEVRGD